jgi:manganese-dependent inorganic pyrophosphatase
MLIAAILSDSLFFRSPTTTKEDIKIVEELNDIAEIENIEEFAKNMFAAKSDL